MKVAVITPYYKESTDILRRCHNSIKSQSYQDVTHIMVADGEPHPVVRTFDAEHMVMPESHADAGATPRAIAAISAFSRGYDAVAFLDVDNWVDSNHIEYLVKETVAHGADGAIATRRIHSLDGDAMYVDTWESNGKEHVDTNCMFFTRSALHVMSKWVTDPQLRLWSDREFWNAVKQSNMKLVMCQTPTVAYVSKWAAHYVNAGRTPAPDAVWIGRDDAGGLIHIKHKDSKEYHES